MNLLRLRLKQACYKQNSNLNLITKFEPNRNFEKLLLKDSLYFIFYANILINLSYRGKLAKSGIGNFANILLKFYA